MKHNHQEGMPCVHMEQLLQGAADGSLKGLRLWYAVMHAARCSRCGTYLGRLRETITRLKEVKRGVPSGDVLSRLEKQIPKS